MAYVVIAQSKHGVFYFYRTNLCADVGFVVFVYIHQHTYYLQRDKKWLKLDEEIAYRKLFRSRKFE